MTVFGVRELAEYAAMAVGLDIPSEYCLIVKSGRPLINIAMKKGVISHIIVICDDRMKQLLGEPE